MTSYKYIPSIFSKLFCRYRKPTKILFT